MKAIHIRRRNLATIHVLTMLAVAGPAAAEQMFVIDRLVLSVYAQASQDSEKIATVQTGDSVEALERVESLVHVRLSDGREGWVGANYLTEQAPAIITLRELQAGQKADDGLARKPLQDEITKLRKENGGLLEQIRALQQQLAAATAAAPAAADEPEPEPDVAEQPNPPPARPTEPGTYAQLWWLLPVAALLGIAIGFPLGYQSLARRIQRKFGGVKIY